MKLVAAAIIYILAFAAHLVPILSLRNQKSYADWLASLSAFGGQPFPGTELLVSTLRLWWVYPVVSVFIFGFLLVYRKNAFVSTLFMVAVALVWWIYFYGPLIAMGRVV